jgi:hypothetical protein
MRGSSKRRKSEIPLQPSAQEPSSAWDRYCRPFLLIEPARRKILFATMGRGKTFAVARTLPYVICMMLAIVILCIFPEIATWLPNHLMGGGS